MAALGELDTSNQGGSNGAKANGYTIGVNVPVGNLDFSVGYAYSKAENTAGATTAKGSALSAGVTYALSKRTRLYGAYLDGDVENATTGAKTFERKFYAVGVRHDF